MKERILTLVEAHRHWEKNKRHAPLTRSARSAFSRSSNWTKTKGGFPALVAHEADGSYYAIVFRVRESGRIYMQDAHQS
jgi:hypothetical protein